MTNTENHYIRWMFVFLAFLVSIFSGSVIALGNLYLTGIMFSALLYFVLIRYPVFSVFGILLFTLFCVGMLALFTSGGDKVTYAVTVVSAAITIPYLIQFFFAYQRRANYPGFLFYLVVFFIFVVVSIIVNYDHIFDAVAGYKRMLQLWPLLTLIPAIMLHSGFLPKWKKAFFVLALLQLPITLYQLIVLVPLRVWTPENPLTPIDVVAGTFGATMQGGGASGVMGLFLVLVIAYFLAAWRVGSIRPVFLWWLLPIAIPLFLGEIKIIALYFPIMFWYVFRGDFLEKPIRFFLVAIFAAVTVFAVVYLYLTFFARFNPAKELQAVIDYNFGDVGYGTYYLNRTSVIRFWFSEQDWRTPIYAILGHGLGSSYGAEFASFSGHIARKYPNYGLSLSSLSVMLWDFGLLGVFAIFAFAFKWWRTLDSLKDQILEDNTDLASIVVVKIFLVFWLISLFYDNSFVVVPSFQALWCIAIMSTCWLIYKNKV